MHSDGTPKYFIIGLSRVVIFICIGIFFLVDNEKTKINTTPIVKRTTTFLQQTTISLSSPSAALDQDKPIDPIHYGWGTFISSDGYFITANHVIESLEGGSSVHYGGKEFFNDTIHIHPEYDIAIIKLFGVTTPCVKLTQATPPESGTLLTGFVESSIDQENISFTYETEIVPGMSGSPIYSEGGIFSGIITQKDNTNEKKGQGIFFTPSLISRIESHLDPSYNSSCIIHDAEAQIQYKS